MSKNLLWSLILLITLALFGMGIKPVQAETYVFDNGLNNNVAVPQIINHPENLQYVYGILGSGEDLVDYYALPFTEDVGQVNFELLVRDSVTNFRPTLIFVDPNQRGMQGQIPFGFPPNLGGRVYPWESGEDIKQADNTMFENFLVGPNFIRDLSANRYLLAVHDPSGKGGRDILHIGAKNLPESISDKFKAVLALIRIKFLLY